MALALNIGKCTLLGNYRENNEDSIEVKQFPDMSLCIVADGMGGQAAGEIASKRAIEVVPRELRKNLTQSATQDQARAVIRKAVVQANEEIITMGSLDRDLKNMGTTIVLALWRKGQDMFIANLGDSRAYLLRSGNLQQLTNDHSLVAEQVRRGLITPQQAEESEMQSVLLRALGAHPEVEIDTDEVEIIPRDVLLLCSDGLTRMVTEPEIAGALQAETVPSAAAERLIALANENGGIDNVTVIVVRFEDDANKGWFSWMRRGSAKKD